MLGFFPPIMRTDPPKFDFFPELAFFVLVGKRRHLLPPVSEIVQNLLEQITISIQENFALDNLFLKIAKKASPSQTLYPT